MPVFFRSPLLIAFTPTAALAAGALANVDVTINRALSVVDAHNLATATNALSASTLARQALGAGLFNTLTTALAMAADGAITRASTGMVAAQATLASTDILRAVFQDGGGAGGANGALFAHVVGLPVVGGT